MLHAIGYMKLQLLKLMPLQINRDKRNIVDSMWLGQFWAYYTI